MGITTIVMEEGGTFMVDGNLSVPDDLGNRHRRKVQAWIDAGNTPTPYAEPVKTWEENRQAEYAKLNQFELIGEDSINGTTKHKDAILAIKAKHPKP